MAEAGLPQFIIIGAAKAATTWIAHQLRAREDMFLPGPEPHFFSREYHRGECWYRRLFARAGDRQHIGEKSADYLADELAAARIAALIPRARLVALLRNPVERAYSDYCMLFRRGQIGSDIARQLDRRRTDAPRFLDDGLYARHLRRYLDHFPADQITVMLHEDIEVRPAEVLDDVCRAISVPPGRPPLPLDARVNDSRAPLAPLSLRRLPAPVKSLVAPLRGNSLFESARRLIARPVDYPPLTDDIRRRLEEFYRDDLAQLAKLVKQDISGWMTRDRMLEKVEP